MNHERGRGGERALLMGVVALLLASIASPAMAASSSAAIMGVVRDAQGVGQMGALVQVLTASSAQVGTAFTDLHGHYQIHNILPGKYQVRASATLFMPATKGNLELRTGAQTVVNLTLAALFDTTQWLPAERRRADEPADDWRWTLRSSANRPILRVLDDGSVVLANMPEMPGPLGELPRISVTSGDGGFGDGGVHGAISIHREMPGGSGVLMLVNAGVGQAGAAPPIEVATGYERAFGLNGTARTMVSFRSHPELIGPDGSRGVAVMEVGGAQTMSLGDLIDLEVGGSMRGVRTASVEGFTSAPFLRATVRPMGSWTIRYELAGSHDLQSAEDLNPEDAMPAIASVGDRLLVERERHQELTVAQRSGRRVIEVAVYRDALSRVAVEGIGASGASNAVMLDPTTGTFRMLAPGYRGDGAEILLSSPLPSGIRATVQYSVGSAMGMSGSGTALAPPMLRQFGSQAATVALKGQIKASGTAVRALYRWQPSRMVTAVNPYGAFSDQGFLSCSMRQPLHWGQHLPPGLEATIDVTNLLREGYRPFLSADGQTLYFAQAPRVMQAGLAFSF